MAGCGMDSYAVSSAIARHVLAWPVTLYRRVRLEYKSLATLA